VAVHLPAVELSR